MKSLINLLGAVVLLGCSVQLKTSLGQKPSHCYVDSDGQQRCFSSEREATDDYRQRRLEAIEHHQASTKSNEDARLEAQQDMTEEAQLREHQLTKNASNPQIAVPVISAILCHLESKRDSLLADVEHEKRVTAVGGVSDLQARREIAEDLESNRESIENWTAKLQTKFAANRVPCAELAPLFACHDDKKTCDSMSAKQLELWRRAEEKLGD